MPTIDFITGETATSRSMVYIGNKSNQNLVWMCLVRYSVSEAISKIVGVSYRCFSSYSNASFLIQVSVRGKSPYLEIHLKLEGTCRESPMDGCTKASSKYISAIPNEHNISSMNSIPFQTIRLFRQSCQHLRDWSYPQHDSVEIASVFTCLEVDPHTNAGNIQKSFTEWGHLVIDEGHAGSNCSNLVT